MVVVEMTMAMEWVRDHYVRINGFYAMVWDSWAVPRRSDTETQTTKLMKSAETTLDNNELNKTNKQVNLTAIYNVCCCWGIIKFAFFSSPLAG